MRALLAVALGMGTLLPTAAIAESVYLLIKSSTHGAPAYNRLTSFVVPMESMDQCEEAGAKVISSERFKGRDSLECIIGK